MHEKILSTLKRKHSRFDYVTAAAILDKEQEGIQTINKFQQRRKMMKRQTGNISLMVGLTLLLMIFIGTAVAWDKPADNMQLVIEKVKADKKLLVAQNMQLTEAEAKAFWPVYEKYQAELFLIRGRTLLLINTYAEDYDDMTNIKAKKLLDDFIATETLRLKLFKAYIPKFQKVMSDVKVARYVQIENKINAGLYYELAARIPLINIEQP